MLFRFISATLILLLSSAMGMGQEHKKLVAQRTEEKISIDGVLNEASWKNNVNVASGFIERTPKEGVIPQYDTYVKIIYNNRSVYVGALMVDKEPSKILKQLGNRDDQLNADIFSVGFDTYNKQQDAYMFRVSASGVQVDSRIQDVTYNAVWNSAVKIIDSGWVVEMEIPYSALRFPSNEIQTWRLQFEREFRRTRGIAQWSLVPRKENNTLSFWGELTGIENIAAPTRLSFTPYVTIATSNSTSPKYKPSAIAGMDMKLGLNEGFTLDATLLPDFSQVRSDNIVKNLNLNEVQFAEQRTFFQEGVDLFNKGDLFYSRRIGDRPIGYYQAGSALDTNEVLTENPTSSRVLNVTKISGRNKKGLGIGILNSVTGSTFAQAFDTTSATYRDILTNPLSNYNIISFDQNLKNNNSVFLINTNVTRDDGGMDANVSATGCQLWDKKNKYRFQGEFRHSALYYNSLREQDMVSTGIGYSVNLATRRGAITSYLNSQGTSPDFNANNLGYTFRTNFRNHTASATYNKFNPFWILNGFSSTITMDVEQNYSEHDINKVLGTFDTWLTTKTFHSFFVQVEGQTARKDYFATPDGSLFMNPGYTYAHLGVSSDYRKAIAIDGKVGRGSNRQYGGGRYFTYNVSPIIRVSDHLKITPSVQYDINKNQVGFAGYDASFQPIYGRRDVNVLTNIFMAKYIFKNNLSLSVRFRHYWQSGQYDYYADLNPNGFLEQNNLNHDRDFNFNAFNTDIVFAWQYAPGSFLTIVYKTALTQDSPMVNLNYMSNLSNVIRTEQLSTLSLKTIYYFDVNRVANTRKKQVQTG